MCVEEYILFHCLHKSLITLAGPRRVLLAHAPPPMAQHFHAVFGKVCILATLYRGLVPLLPKILDLRLHSTVIMVLVHALSSCSRSSQCVKGAILYCQGLPLCIHFSPLWGTRGWELLRQHLQLNNHLHRHVFTMLICSLTPTTMLDTIKASNGQQSKIWDDRLMKKLFRWPLEILWHHWSNNLESKKKFWINWIVVSTLLHNFCELIFS